MKCRQGDESGFKYLLDMSLGEVAGGSLLAMETGCWLHLPFTTVNDG